MGACAPDVTAWPGDRQLIGKKIVDRQCVCEKTSFPLLRKICILSYTLQSERTWTRAETHGRLKGNRSSFVDYLKMLTGTYTFHLLACTLS